MKIDFFFTVEEGLRSWTFWYITVVVWLCFTRSYAGWQFCQPPWPCALPISAWLCEAEMVPD